MNDAATVLATDHDAVRLLTLNRPGKKNAFNVEMADALSTALLDAANDDGVRAVVLHGAGDSFSSGADVHIFLALSQGRVEGIERFLSLDSKLRLFPKPLIAAVHGQAVGMGVTLLPHFDMVYAAEDATFLIPFSRLGLTPEFGSTWTLARLIGRQRANEMVLVGEPLDAATACEWGLVTRLFPAAEILKRSLAIGQLIARHPRGAVMDSKALLRDDEDLSLEEATARENSVLSGRYGSAENVAAVEAFLASRGTRRV